MILLAGSVGRCAAQAATLQARSAPANVVDTVVFLVNDTPLPGVVASTLEPDGSRVFSMPAPLELAVGDRFDVRLCNAAGCTLGVLEDGSPGPLIVASLPPPPPPPPLPPLSQALIKRLDADTGPGHWRALVKDRDFNADPTGVRLPNFEARPQSLAWWTHVSAEPLTSPPGTPANESVHRIADPWPGCSEYRLTWWSIADGRVSPVSLPVVSPAPCLVPAPERVPIAVPEPSRLAGLGAGILALCGLAWRAVRPGRLERAARADQAVGARHPAPPRVYPIRLGGLIDLARIPADRRPHAIAGALEVVAHLAEFESRGFAIDEAESPDFVEWVDDGDPTVASNFRDARGELRACLVSGKAGADA